MSTLHSAKRFFRIRLFLGLAALLNLTAAALHAAVFVAGDPIVSDVTNSSSTSFIAEVTPGTGALTTLTSVTVSSSAPLLDTARFLTLSPAGTLYYVEAADATNAGRLVSVNLSTGVRTLIGGSAFVSVAGMCWDPSTSMLVVSDAGTSVATSSVVRVNPANGNRTTIASSAVGTGASFDTAKFVVCSPAGVVYYYESADTTNAGKLVSISATNVRAVVGSSTFTSVAALAWESSTSKLLVSDAGTSSATSALLRIDPAGVASPVMIASGSVGSGAAFDTAQFVASASDGTIYYYESADSTNAGKLVKIGGTVRSVITGAAYTAFAGLTVVAAPSITSVTAPANLAYKAGQPLNFTVNFTAAVTVAGGTPSFSLTVGSTTRSATYASGSGTAALVFSYTVQAGETDADGIAVSSPIVLNGATIRDSSSSADAILTFTPPTTTGVLIDTTPPTVNSINRVAANPTKVTSVTYTVVFSESVTGVDSTDFSLSTVSGNVAGTVASVSGSSSTYTVTVNSVTGDGDLRLDLKSSGTGIADGATNAVAAGFTSGQSYTFDHTAPAVASINLGGTSPTNGASATYTATFSENVTGVDTTDFTLTTITGTAAGTIASVTGSGATYTVTVNSLTGDGTLRLDLKSSGTGIADGVANAIAAGYSAGQVYTVDHTAPTVSSINRTASVLTNAASVTYTVTFDEGITGLDTSDFTLTGATGNVAGTVSAVTGSGAVYTVTAGSLTGDGTLRLDLKSSGTGIADLASNAISAGYTSGQTYTVDHTAPTVNSINRTASAQTNAASVTYAVVFGESVTGVDTSDFALTATGTATGTVSGVAGSGASYTVTVSSITGDGTLRLDLNGSGTGIADTATNAIAAGFTSGQTYTFDHTAPTVSSINRAAASPSNATSVAYTVLFSESVTGVDATDFSLTPTGNVAGTIASVSGTGTTYTVTVNSLIGDGTLRLDLNGSGTGIQDAVTNPVSGGFTSGQTYSLDHTVPTISIGAPSVAATNTGPVTYTVTYADTNFNAATLSTGNLTLNATGSATATLAVSGSGTTRTVALSSITGNGTLGISIAAGTASDTAGGLAPTAGPSTTFMVDNVAPTVSSVARLTPAVVNTAAASLTYRVTFSESVSGVDASDFTLSVLTGSATGSVATATPQSGSVYDIDVTGVSGVGALKLAVNSSGTGIVDDGGNALSATGGPWFATYVVGTGNVWDATTLAPGGAATVSDTSHTKVAQRFTTSAAAPLFLSKLAVQLGSLTIGPAPTVTINADSAGVPGAVVATSAGVAGPQANRLSVFNLGVLLSPSTTYWVVFAETSGTGSTYEVINTTATTGGSGAWLGGADYAYKTFNGSTWSSANAGALQVALGVSLAPSIIALAPPANGAYRAGVALNFTATFDVAPTVSTTGGTPYLPLTIGSTARQAAYVSGTGTTSLVFSYTVQPGDTDTDGIVVTSPLVPNGGTIDSNLIFTAPDTTGVRVDTTAPTASIAVATPALKAGTTSLVTITFSERVTGLTNTSLSADNGTLSPISTADSGLTWTATLTPAGSTTATTNVVTLANGGVADLAGNLGVGTTTSNNYTVDTALPTLSAVSIASNNASPSLAKTGDTVVVTFTASEAIATPAVTLAGHAATVANTSGNTYTATTTMLGTDSQGTVAFSISFADLAGNAGTAVTATTNASAVSFDRTVPTLSAVSIASNNLNTARAKTGDSVVVTFTASEPVALPAATIAGRAATVVNTSGNTYTATTTMLGTDAEGAVAFSLSFTDLTGNAGTAVTATTNASSVAFDRSAPTLGAVSIASNNTGPSRAKTGDNVVVTFTAVEPIATPSATIAGHAATVVNTSGNTYTATTTMLGTDAEGTVAFSISFTDVTGNPGAAVAATTNASSVTFDRSVPTLSAVSIASNNAAPSRAKTGDNVVVTFTASEAIALPTATVAGRAATVVNTTGNTYTATVTMLVTDAEGAVAFSLSFADLTGNAGTAVTATTNASAATFDRTPPTLSAVSIASSNATASRAKTGDTVTVTFTASETVALPTATIAGRAATVANTSGNTYTATTTMLAGDAEGVIALSLSFVDLTGNVGTAVTATTNASAVTFDRIAPTLSGVAIASNNATTSRAKTGDTVTVTFTASESVALPAATIAGHAATVVNTSGNTYTATTAMLGTDAEGAVAFSLSFVDLTGNAGTAVTATTNASSVTFDRTAPTLSAVSIASNNATPSRAKVGNTVTVTFTASEAVALPVATVAGHAAAVANTSGNTYTATATMLAGDAEGPVAFSISFTDVTGNAGTAVTATTNASAVTFDKTLPTLGAVSIASNNANPIWARTGNTVTVTFTASEAVATPTGTVAGHAATIANTAGNTYTATVTMLVGDPEGAVTFSLSFTDTTGNAGTAVTATTDASVVTFDRTAPTAPVIAAITNDTGSSATDFITSDPTLVLSGTAEANSTVTVTRLGTGVLGTATTNGAGAWSYDYTGTTLAAGDHSFTATAADAAGNVSPVSATLIVTVDTVTAAPVIASITTDTGSSSIDGVTSDNTLTLTGTAEANSVVTLTRSGFTGPIGTATANGSGAWSFVYGTALLDGSYLFNASALDPAGNTSAASADFPVVIDTVAPVAPVIAAITTDTGSSATDRLTSDPTLILSGTAEANSRVTVTRVGTGVLGTATADGTGVWSYDYTGTSLPEGVTNFTATATDLAGNMGVASATFAVTVDLTAPTLSSVAIASSNTVTTKARVGDTVTVTFTANEVVATPSATVAGRAATVVNTSGNTYTASTGLLVTDPEGAVAFSISFTDAAGNAGTAVTTTTNASSVVFDRTLPTLASVTIASSNTAPSRAKVGDTVTVTFTASEAVATPTATITGHVATVVNTSGNTFTASTTLLAGDAEGPVAFSIAFSDATGNAGIAVTATTNASSVTFDRTAPTLASVIIASGNANPIWAKTGDAVTVTFTASEAVATPSATIAGQVATVALVSGNTYTATTTMLAGDAEGTVAFSLSFVDLTGNSGATVTVTTNASAVTFDKTAPVITSAATASTSYKTSFSYASSATGGAGSFGATGLPAGLTINAATGAITGAVSTNGTFTVGLTAVDAAGNIGTANLSLTVAKAGLTVTGITVASRVYDATTTATLMTTGAQPVGVVSGDAVTLVTSGATGAFATKAAGSAKPVAITGLTLTGGDAANYTLTQPIATGDVTPLVLTVTGITASDRPYNGGTLATINTGSAQLVGVLTAVPAEDVTLVTSAAVGNFTSPNAAPAKPVVISGLTLAGADGANYTITPPTALASISPAAVVIAITNLSFTYDGTPKAATVTLSPPVAASIVYSGGSVPTNAGTYTVSVTATDGNFAGSSSATLTIAKATQTVAFSITGSDFSVGSTLGLTASASSGLPVTFSLVSGSAGLSGSSVTITQPGAVTLRASQTGDNNYNPASADQGFTGVAVAKTAQTISFGSLSDHVTTDIPFGLGATATSGLSVTFAVVGGPASLSGGNIVSLSGAPGIVTIRASQAGNATFAAAPDVTRTFNVVDGGSDTFFGDLVDDSSLFGGGPVRGELVQSTGPRPDAKSGDIAAVYYPATRRGTVIIVAPVLGLNVSIDFVIGADGTYSSPFTSAGRSLTLTGTLNGSTLIGRIPAFRVGFITTVQSRTGTTANIAGFYESDSLNTATGGTASIVGPNGQILIVASTATVTTGAVGTVTADGKFNVSAPGATITGSVDAATTAVSGTITVPGQGAVSFSGLGGNTVHTDRLANLSSRVRVGPLPGRTLITGFVIGGSASKRVLLRATGPALTGFGVQGALTNPRLQLFDATGHLLLENDDWSGTETSSAATQVGAFSLIAGSKDAALVTTLQPGAYTMQVLGGSETGVALAEIYDASTTSATETQRLVNISTRGEAAGGENALIAGFVVTGNAPKKVLIRGVGPGLAAFGVAETLADPQLRVVGAAGLIAANDNWSAVATDAATVNEAGLQVGAFALVGGSKDAALVLTLAPGNYTAEVGAANGTSTGVALVEVYELP